MCWERLLKYIHGLIFSFIHTYYVHHIIRKGKYVFLVLKLFSHDPKVLKTYLAMFKYYFATPTN